ncbi:MAG: OmpH family outer membrane protein [Bacteroidales bacterium]|jgi:outer membrane protein|nr:OmpH family outer membrane protein [Bacteroidales bacterium]MBQ4298687.1 OmpH family outer membrane protein [Bacteroidales bacterium]
MKKIVIIAAMALVSFSAYAQKLARVNFSELVQLMPEADQARATLKAVSQEAEETLQTMYQEYQTKMSQYQQKSASWSDAIKKSKETELMDIQRRIEENQQVFQQEIQQKQSELMAPIYQKAQDAVKELAKSKGITALFDSSSALYFDESAVEDLTAAARKALNIPADRTLEALQAELAAEQQAQQK